MIASSRVYHGGLLGSIMMGDGFNVSRSIWSEGEERRRLGFRPTPRLESNAR